MKPDSRDDAVAIMVLFVLALIFLALIGGGAAAFLRYSEHSGM